VSTVAPGPSDVCRVVLVVAELRSKVIGHTSHTAMTTPETSDRAVEVSEAPDSGQQELVSRIIDGGDAKEPKPPNVESTPSQTINDSTIASQTTIPSSPAVRLPPPPTPIPASPAPRRPKPPTKGILKPPPPPGKPTLSNRLRDIAGVAKSLFDPLEDPSQQASSSTQANGKSNGTNSRQVEGNEAGPSVSSAFTAFSGRLGAGFNRLVVAASQTQTQSSPGQANGNGTTPGSPMGLRSISLPEAISSPLGFGGSERSRQKQPLKRATFVLPSLSITYPISSQGEPWSLKVVEDRDRVSLVQHSRTDDRSNQVIGIYCPRRLVLDIGQMRDWYCSTRMLPGEETRDQKLGSSVHLK
jgi:protein phosphatase 1 regulatory subunit 37